MTKTWELALGIIFVAVSLPFLLVGVVLWMVMPIWQLVAVIAFLILAFGIGFMYNSGYWSKKPVSPGTVALSRTINYCIKCGKPLHRGAEFCAKCGTKVPLSLAP